MSKLNDVMTGINEGKSNTQLKEEYNCSQATITRARNILKKDEPEPEYDATDDEVTEEYNTNFVKEIKIEPDPETLTKDVKEKTYDLECGSCGYEWTVSKNEEIIECPECGVEF